MKQFRSQLILACGFVLHKVNNKKVDVTDAIRSRGAQTRRAHMYCYV